MDLYDLIPTDGWRWHAACAEVDPELFYPVGTTDSALLQIEDAKRVCRRCPVLIECLATAMTGPKDHHGILGGLTADERTSLRRREARKASRTVGAA